MYVAYIAHPIGGDVENNLKKILKIVRLINTTEPNVIPFVPYYVDVLALKDNILRERGIKNNIALMERGFIDEIRLYGDKISKGMKAEIELAKKLNISVIPHTIATERDYEKLIKISSKEKRY